MHDPFHSGERSVQEQAGVRDAALLNGRLIAGRIPAAATQFLTQQHSCVLGWSSAAGEVWALFLGGPQGFAFPDEDGQILYLRLHDDLRTLSRLPPLAEIREGDRLGALFIELATRRRLRVNGRVARIGDDEVALAVDQANPLCPKYIQRRRLEEREPEPVMSGVRKGEILSEDLISWITGADTFFVASALPDRTANVSHRGGRPGFVRFHDGTLRIPDYPGNNMFNTLGNFALHPRAGLVFVDFAANRQLQMTGDARLDLSAGPGAGETGGTGRWWEFQPHAWIVSPLNRTFAWTFLDESPFNP